MTPPAEQSPAGADAHETAQTVRRAQRGDVEAFEALYRAHVDRVYALCLRMTGRPEHASELVQDVFVRCWERLRTFRGDSRFGTWLHRVAVNVVLEEARRSRRRDDRIEVRAEDALPPTGRSPQHDERLDLERAIQALPPKAREVFVLHDIEGYRHREIAQMTGAAQGTLRAQLHRARRLLMENLS